MELSSLSCPKCNSPINQADYFCKSCGAKIKNKALSTTLFMQLKIYVFSLLLPLLGLIPAIKYLRQEDRSSKKIGVVIVVITILSLVITTWLTMGYLNTFNESLNKQMEIYKDLSY